MLTETRLPAPPVTYAERRDYYRAYGNRGAVSREVRAWQGGLYRLRHGGPVFRVDTLTPGGGVSLTRYRPDGETAGVEIVSAMDLWASGPLVLVPTAATITAGQGLISPADGRLSA